VAKFSQEHSSETLMVMGASFTYILLELPDAWLSTITLWINITNYQVRTYSPIRNMKPLEIENVSVTSNLVNLY
jgi:hypothetical protein